MGEVVTSHAFFFFSFFPFSFLNARTAYRDNHGLTLSAPNDIFPCILVIIIIIIITIDNVYGAVIVTQSLREFTRFIRRMQTSARRPPTLRPGQPTWAASPSVGCYMAYIHHHHLLLLSSKADTHFPTEGGRLSQPRHTACIAALYNYIYFCAPTMGTFTLNVNDSFRR